MVDPSSKTSPTVGHKSRTLRMRPCAPQTGLPGRSSVISGFCTDAGAPVLKRAPPWPGLGPRRSSQLRNPYSKVTAGGWAHFFLKWQLLQRPKLFFRLGTGKGPLTHLRMKVPLA